MTAEKKQSPLIGIENVKQFIAVGSGIGTRKNFSANSNCCA
jgi:hypothetical protein